MKWKGNCEKYSINGIMLKTKKHMKKCVFLLLPWVLLIRPH